jgi:hypothetical protein
MLIGVKTKADGARRINTFSKRSRNTLFKADAPTVALGSGLVYVPKAALAERTASHA